MFIKFIFNTVSGLIIIFIAIHYCYYIIKCLIRMSDDAKYIKKKWKGGTIEPHPTEKALVVNYQLEAAVFGEPDNPMLEDKKECQRIIRLKSLNSKTDPAALAREVVDKCDLIHKSQLSEVEQIIYYLKNRKVATSSNDNNSQRSASRRSAKPTPPEASIRNLDEYVELLYEDVVERTRGSNLILTVARNPDNLEELEKNEAALSALSRVLREDWRKSLDLSTNIIYTFFCFSTYTKFHPVIVQYKIGSLCMDVVDYELRRYECMRNELDVRKNPGDSRDASKETLNKSSDDFLDIMNEEKPKEMEPPRRRIPELKQRPKSGNWSSYHGTMTSSLIKSQILNNSFHEQLSSEINKCTDDMKSNSSETLNGSNDPKAKKDEIDRLNKHLKVFARKQEQLLRVAFYLLLNMAENVKLEEKMRRKNIVKMLVKALDRQNIELLVLVITFLKKLSIVCDNKDEMNELNIVEKLPRLLNSGHADLVQVTLKLIFNLSFDGKIRSKMVRAGYLPKLVAFISDDKHHGIIVKILYHFSLDDKVKSMFTYTECVPLVTDCLILNLNKKCDLDLIALCINLALNKRNAQIMSDRTRLHSLMERAFKYEDAFLMKMIRNISQHEGLRNCFIDFVGDLAKIITICDNEDFIVECIGILGNLSLPDLDYSQILQNFELIPWIRETLLPGKKQDDLVLDTVILLGTCACDESCAMLMCRSNVVISLIELLKAKQEDDEIVLQICFVFWQILKNESTRDYMIKETESPAYLIDLMHDKNSEIRKVCDYCLDIIAMSNQEWASRIKLEKFRNHNSQWLSMVEAQDQQEDYGANEEDDAELPNYLASDYLDQCEIYNSGDDNESNNSQNNQRGSPALSNYGRPVSSYRRSQDIEDLETITTNSKNHLKETVNSDIFLMKMNKTLDSELMPDDILVA